MKKQIKMAIAALVLLGSVHAMAEESAEFDLEHTRIMANQSFQMKDMIDEMNDFHQEVGLTSTAEGNKVGQLTKLIVEAEIIRDNVDLSESEEEIYTAWSQVKALHQMACEIARGKDNCK
ncbi:hypothetical protein [Bdellovibrio sp. HCB-162]|uniref:hypothetical protein n=1 Tax=Bdellovibrio sp. HCB-162 TaxID=3394234 RepID=UPI0039BD233D